MLARVCSDKAIAGFLNRNGLKTGRGNRWTKERIVSMRNDHQIPCHCPETKEQEGWLTLTEAAKLLGISSRTLRLAVERGEVPELHPLSVRSGPPPKSSACRVESAPQDVPVEWFAKRSGLQRADDWVLSASVPASHQSGTRLGRPSVAYSAQP